MSHRDIARRLDESADQNTRMRGAYGSLSYAAWQEGEREVTDDVLIAAVHRVINSDGTATVLAFGQLCALEGI